MDQDRVRVDLHTHTSHSLDAWMAPARLVARARRAGLDRIAVTDHGTLRGALVARDLDPELVIVGEEIRCEGEIDLLGLFLTEHVPDGLSLREAAERVRGQGGVVLAPHPFAYPRDAVHRAEQVLAVADAVEIFNSRAFLPQWNWQARRAAASRGLPGLAGSDAHFPWELGRCHAELPCFADAAEFRQVATQARIVSARVANPLIHVASLSLEVVRRIGDRLPRLPARMLRSPTGTGVPGQVAQGSRSRPAIRSRAS